MWIKINLKHLCFSILFTQSFLFMFFDNFGGETQFYYFSSGWELLVEHVSVLVPMLLRTCLL